MCIALASILIPTVMIDLAPHFKVVDEMFKDDEEEDERRHSLDLSL